MKWWSYRQAGTCCIRICQIISLHLQDKSAASSCVQTQSPVLPCSAMLFQSQTATSSFFQPHSHSWGVPFPVSVANEALWNPLLKLSWYPGGDCYWKGGQPKSEQCHPCWNLPTSINQQRHYFLAAKANLPWHHDTTSPVATVLTTVWS